MLWPRSSRSRISPRGLSCRLACPRRIQNRLKQEVHKAKDHGVAREVEFVGHRMGPGDIAGREQGVEEKHIEVAVVIGDKDEARQVMKMRRTSHMHAAIKPDQRTQHRKMKENPHKRSQTLRIHGRSI